MRRRRFVYLRKDGSKSKPLPLRKVLDVARQRVGFDRYTLVREAKVIGTNVPRRPALRRTKRILKHQTPGKKGPTVRIKDNHDVVFAAREVDVTSPDDERRKQMVAWSRWCVGRAATIHYSQDRPFNVYAPGTSVMTLDCSGFAILMSEWAGAPDPSGFSHSGYGNSASIAERSKQIQRAALQPGDLVVFGYPTTTHVSVVVEVGADPLCVSHGQESGPYAIRLSSESSGHSGQQVRFFALV